MSVIGLTGQEPVITLENNTFCSLCQRVIRRGDEAVAAGGGEGGYLIHPDCALAHFTGELHRVEVKDVRKKGKTRAKRQEKKEHVSTGETVCCFCRKVIPEGQTYVLNEKLPYHNTGRSSCIKRFRAVNSRTAFDLR